MRGFLIYQRAISRLKVRLRQRLKRENLSGRKSSFHWSEDPDSSASMGCGACESFIEDIIYFVLPSTIVLQLQPQMPS